MKLLKKHPVVFLLINMTIASLLVCFIGGDHYVFGSLEANVGVVFVAWAFVSYVLRRELRELILYVLYGEQYLEIQFLLNGIRSRRTLTEKDNLPSFIRALQQAGAQDISLHPLPPDGRS